MTHNVDFGPRPEPTQADIDHDKLARTPVGPWRLGWVILFSSELGIGYISEKSTDRRFGLSRNFHDEKLLESLNCGDRVMFRPNASNTIAKIKKAPAKFSPPYPLFPWVSKSDVGKLRTGVITQYIPEFHQYSLRDDGGEHTLAAVKKFTDPSVYDVLAVGVHVKFRATKKLPRVIFIEIVPELDALP